MFLYHERKGYFSEWSHPPKCYPELMFLMPNDSQRQLLVTVDESSAPRVDELSMLFHSHLHVTRKDVDDQFWHHPLSLSAFCHTKSICNTQDVSCTSFHCSLLRQISFRCIVAPFIPYICSFTFVIAHSYCAASLQLRLTNWNFEQRQGMIDILGLPNSRQDRV
jgi:hypothetical protein